LQQIYRIFGTDRFKAIGFDSEKTKIS